MVNIYRAMANRTEAARAFTGLANTVYRGETTLTPKHAELAYLTATVVTTASTEFPLIRRSVGVSD